MRACLTLVGLLVLLGGCAVGPQSTEQEAAYFRNCQTSKPSDTAASLEFAGKSFALQWQRRCEASRARVFEADGGEGEPSRLVTLARYPPSAKLQRTMDAYIARSASERIGKPRVFERGGSGARRKLIAELMLRHDSYQELEYVLHGVAATDSGRVVSVTYTHRFSAAGEDPARRIKERQGRWVASLERLLETFPAPDRAR